MGKSVPIFMVQMVFSFVEAVESVQWPHQKESIPAR